MLPSLNQLVLITAASLASLFPISVGAQAITTTGTFAPMSFVKNYPSPWFAQPGNQFVSRPVVGLRQFNPTMGKLTAVIASIVAIAN